MDKSENEFRTLLLNFRERSHWAEDMRSSWDWRAAQTWIWDTTSSCWIWWWWQMRGMRTDPDWTSEYAGFRSEQSAERRSQAGGLAGWLAGRTATWKTDWASRDGVYPPPTNPLTVNRLGGQCRRQSSLPSAALLGVCSADSDWGALTLSAAWHAPVFLPTGQEDTEPWQIEEDRGTFDSGSLSLDVRHSDMFILCICCR